MDDVKFLRDTARIARELDIPETAGLRSLIGMRNYVRIAREINAGSSGTILDWGAGFGQIASLLTRAGRDVISYDVGSAFADVRLPITWGLIRVLGGHPFELPFKSGSFGAAISCGVLEHVPDRDASLDELRRVLQPGGRLFIYQLPQKRSYKEAVIRKMSLGYAHESLFTGESIRRLLSRHGYKVLRLRRGGFLPHNLTGLPNSLKSVYNKGWRVTYVIDRALSAVPLVNRTAEALEVIAET